jgi:hypothetical protein
MAEQRFVVQVNDLPIPADVKARIEHAINRVVTEELARIDTRGDLVITPLSAIKSYGQGIGGTTAGMFARSKDSDPKNGPRE